MASILGGVVIEEEEEFGEEKLKLSLLLVDSSGEAIFAIFAAGLGLYFDRLSGVADFFGDLAESADFLGGSYAVADSSRAANFSGEYDFSGEDFSGETTFLKGPTVNNPEDEGDVMIGGRIIFHSNNLTLRDQT